MVFVPREPFSAALPGLAPPRAVPSDLVVAAVSRVLPADLVQKVVLLAIFVLACSGAAALLDREPLLARLAAGVFYAWNPYVGERLIIGQWALLLGYAGLPWVLRAVLAPDLVTRRGVVRLGLALLPAVIGGFAAMAITALVAVPAALLTRSPPPGRRGPGRASRGQPALVHPVPAARGIRRSGQRRGVRGPGRHAIRQPRQPAHAGRRLERADGPEGLRRSLVGPVAGRSHRRPGRVRPGRAPPTPLARPGPGCGSRAGARGPGRDRGGPGLAPVHDRCLAGLRRPARRPAVRRAAGPGRGRRLRPGRGGSPEPRSVPKRAPVPDRPAPLTWPRPLRRPCRRGRTGPTARRHDPAGTAPGRAGPPRPGPCSPSSPC